VDHVVAKIISSKIQMDFVQSVILQFVIHQMVPWNQLQLVTNVFVIMVSQVVLTVRIVVLTVVLTELLIFHVLVVLVILIGMVPYVITVS
jgi:hypothetical protein